MPNTALRRSTPCMSFPQASIPQHYSYSSLLHENPLGSAKFPTSASALFSFRYRRKSRWLAFWLALFSVMPASIQDKSLLICQSQQWSSKGERRVTTVVAICVCVCVCVCVCLSDLCKSVCSQPQALWNYFGIKPQDMEILGLGKLWSLSISLYWKPFIHQLEVSLFSFIVCSFTMK